MMDGPKSTNETRTINDPEGEGYALLVSAKSGVSAVRLPQKPTFVIGRSSSCDLVVADDSVSREHARLLLGERLTVEDLGSKNGVRVGGERIPSRSSVPIGIGSVFELGSVTFVLQRPSGIPASEIHPPRPGESPDARGAVVEDPTMQRLYALLDLVAPSPLAVLILGETGVGKEVFAQALHDKSPRARAPFVPVHCAALPESMLEAELFGYERGAFTGATQNKPGLLEAADGGTVFLDEIGEVPLAMQAKLLRVIETREIRRLGSVKGKRLDVRFVSATHRDLRARIGEGTFRADLYFRLNGLTLTLPPLRERKADIVPMASAFLARAAAAANRAPPALVADAVALLEAYAWPGNVRELHSVMERGVLLCPGPTLSREVLERAAPDLVADKPAPAGAKAADDGSPAPNANHDANDADALRERLHDLERKRIENALSETGGNQSRAAKILGMSRYALMHRMEVFGLVRPRKKR